MSDVKDKDDVTYGSQLVNNEEETSLVIDDAVDGREVDDESPSDDKADLSLFIDSDIRDPLIPISDENCLTVLFFITVMFISVSIIGISFVVQHI